MTHNYRKDKPLAKPNYQFEKRQRELAKKKKKEEKKLRKLSDNPLESETHDAMPPAAPPAAGEGQSH